MTRLVIFWVMFLESGALTFLKCGCDRPIIFSNMIARWTLNCCYVCMRLHNLFLGSLNQSSIRLCETTFTSMLSSRSMRNPREQVSYTQHWVTQSIRNTFLCNNVCYNVLIKINENPLWTSFSFTTLGCLGATFSSLKLFENGGMSEL